AHAAAFDHHALGAQPLRLLAPPAGAFREGDAAVAAQDAVPGQFRILVAAQDPRHQPRPARQAGAARDVAVAGHLPARHGADRGEDALLGGVFGHWASIAAVRDRETAPCRTSSRSAATSTPATTASPCRTPT